MMNIEMPLNCNHCILPQQIRQSHNFFQMALCKNSPATGIRYTLRLAKNRMLEVKNVNLLRNKKRQSDLQRQPLASKLICPETKSSGCLSSLQNITLSGYWLISGCNASKLRAAEPFLIKIDKPGRQFGFHFSQGTAFMIGRNARICITSHILSR